MKKLMIVAPYFYPKIGGLENYAYNIGIGLKRKYKWDVVVITSNHLKKKYKEEKINGLKIYRLPYLFKISNTPINPLWYFQIKKIIEKEKPDVINAHTPVPFISDITSAVKGKIPFILTYHSGSMKKGKLSADIVINFYEKCLLPMLISRSNRIICSSDFVKNNMFKKYSKKTLTIAPGIDIKKYKPNFKLNPSNKLLYIGKIDKSSEWKGIKYLLEAIKIVKNSIPSIQLTLVGEGNQIKYFKDYSRKIGIEKNVLFVGEKKGQDKIKIIQSSNTLILPSISNAESFGIVLIEALACQKSVIGSRIGGIPYIIEHNKTGLLVSPKNEYKLSKAILSIIKNTKLHNKLSQAGREKVISKFDLDQLIDKTGEILLQTNQSLNRSFIL